MQWYIPLFSCKKETKKLLKKLKRSSLMCGVYNGYNMDDHEVAVLYKGFLGWNLFINEKASDTMIRCALYYLLKNKKAFLFDMKNAEEHKIELNCELK